MFFRLLIAVCFAITVPPVHAQVEIYRNNEDTSTYIAPEDTITSAPVFGIGVQDFLRYIEINFRLQNQALTLDFAGENIRFSFYVNKNGEVSDYTPLYGSNAIVADEVERIVSGMPKWTPGYFQGRKKKTLMVYNILVRRVNDFPPVEVTLNTSTMEYSDQTKQLKIFIVAASVLISASLWIISFLK